MKLEYNFKLFLIKRIYHDMASFFERFDMFRSFEQNVIGIV